MAAVGGRKRITTPSYAEFIEVLAFTFDQKPDERNGTRADAMSVSRSMRGKQIVYQQIIPKLLSTWEIKKERHKVLETIFFKIENILSHLKSITICSTRQSDYGSEVFFKDIALPQVIEILRFLSETEDNGFWSEMLSYLVDIACGNETAHDCITRLKNEANSLLEGSRASDFKVWLGKLDARSFPKVKSIDNSLSGLRDELLKGSQGSVELDNLIIKLKYKFLAAKASLNALKFIVSNQYSKPFPLQTELAEAHSQLCADYICNKNYDEFNFEFSKDKSFATLKMYFLAAIENLPRENIPRELASTAGNLLAYKDGAFLPWCAAQKFIWDLNRGNVDKAYIFSFEEMFLSTTKNYQYGRLGVEIASYLLATKIRTSNSIPHRSLEPLVMIVMANTATGNELLFRFATPYGPEQSILSETSEFNITKAVELFNEAVKTNIITQAICNPLENLDEILQSIFDLMDEEFKFSNALKKRPAKTVSWDLYDTLKSINKLLYWHNLFETMKFDLDSAIYVEKSLAGNFIDKYLALDDLQKRKILRKISPEQYNADMEKAQSAH
jgi:hypothetical protein